VPGYPPPPPYGAPGHDPSAPGPAERAPDAPAGDAPTTVAATEAYRSGVPVTGTPGATKKMSPGDVVEVEIEGIGVLRNPVTA